MIGYDSVLTTVPVQRTETDASAVEVVQELQGWALLQARWESCY